MPVLRKFVLPAVSCSSSARKKRRPSPPSLLGGADDSALQGRKNAYARPHRACSAERMIMHYKARRFNCFRLAVVQNHALHRGKLGGGGIFAWPFACDTMLPMYLCCCPRSGLTAPAVLPAVSYRDSKPRDNVASSTRRAAQARAVTATASSKVVGNQDAVASGQPR